MQGRARASPPTSIASSVHLVLSRRRYFRRSYLVSITATLSDESSVQKVLQSSVRNFRTHNN